MMEKKCSPGPVEQHTSTEFRNLWVCQKIIRDWTSHPEWESYDVLPILYRALHTGEKFIPGGISSPKLSAVVRTTDASLVGNPEDLLPRASHVYLLTSRFSTDLDRILRDKPKTIEQTVRDAAFAYYTFERIHPFPDGNGRIGRMIVKRIFKGSNLKDPVFHNPGWYEGGRSTHLDVLEEVGETNNLARLEIFLLQSLVGMYHPFKDFFRYREISRIMAKKENEAGENNNHVLSDIWEGFNGLPLYGN